MKASDRKKWLSGKYRGGYAGIDIGVVNKADFADVVGFHLGKNDIEWMLTALANRKNRREK